MLGDRQLMKNRKIKPVVSHLHIIPHGARILLKKIRNNDAAPVLEHDILTMYIMREQALLTSIIQRLINIIDGFHGNINAAQ